MASPIEIALNQVFYSIPNEILYRVFQNQSESGLPIPVHESVKRHVIVGRVLQEVNTIGGGKQKEVPLKEEYEESVEQTELYRHWPSQSYRLYRIPPEEREGVEIADVIEVRSPMNSAGMPYPSYGHSGLGNTAPDAANKALESYTGQSYMPKPMVEPIGGDMVRISPANFQFVEWTLVIKLCYDQNFTNLNKSAIMPFAKLVVAAVKSYIYNKLILQMDRIEIEGGVELSNFRTIVEGYEMAEDEYQELLSNFKGAATLDPQRMRTILWHQM